MPAFDRPPALPPRLWFDPVSESVSLLPLAAIAPLKKSLQPLPPLPPAVLHTSSITSTMPITRPSASRTGRCRYLCSYISRRASSSVRSPVTQSGFGVITSDTRVSSGDRPLAITRFSRSFGVRMPSSSLFLPASITNTPLRISAISFDASVTVAPGSTLSTLPVPMMLRRVGTEPPNICSIIAWIASNWFLLVPRPPAAFFMASVIAFATSFDADAPSSLPSPPCTFSRIEMASYRHLAMSSRPTTTPCSSSTGRWRKRLSTIISSASRAESDECTHLGFFVITAEVTVPAATRDIEITRRVTSLSVRMPDKAPSASSSSAASTRLRAIFLATSKMLSVSSAVMGALGLSLDTGRSDFLSFSFSSTTSEKSNFLEILLEFAFGKFSLLTVEPTTLALAADFTAILRLARGDRPPATLLLGDFTFGSSARSC